MSGRQIREKIEGIKFWLREPIHAQVKQELTDKKIAQIGDLGLKSSPVKRESLLSRFCPASRQSIADLHGTNTRYLCQPRFRYKVESINLTNNFGSKHRPLCVSHTWPSLIIHIKDKRIRLPNAQKHGPNC